MDARRLEAAVCQHHVALDDQDPAQPQPLRPATQNGQRIAVVVAAAAPHRAEAFEACRFAIDTLKETVPIWKKEFATDGEYWVDEHP